MTEVRDVSEALRFRDGEHPANWAKRLVWFLEQQMAEVARLQARVDQLEAERAPATQPPPAQDPLRAGLRAFQSRCRQNEGRSQ